MQGIFADSAVFRENRSLKRLQNQYVRGKFPTRGARNYFARAGNYFRFAPGGIAQIITGCLCDRPTALRACCLGGQVEYTRSAAKRRCQAELDARAQHAAGRPRRPHDGPRCGARRVDLIFEPPPIKGTAAGTALTSSSS
jgi:hypothetical protein